MKTKRILCLMLAGAMAFGLAACGSSSNSGSTDSTGSADSSDTASDDTEIGRAHV